MEYKKRIIDKILKDHMEAFGATLITGPKGCGKTTTAKQTVKTVIEFQDEEKRDNYINIVNYNTHAILDYEKPILFDEWQDAPKIWGAIRKYCDDNPEMNGMFILTGSSSKDIKTPHTGTLRISRLKMYPMSLYETNESNGSVSLQALFDNNSNFKGCKSNLSFNDLIFAICRGGWPKSLLNKTDNAKLMIAKALVQQTYECDISAIDDVKRNPLITQNILKSYARNLCTLAKTKIIYDDINSNYELSETTFNDYLLALKKLYIIDDVTSWNPSIRSKTAIRSNPKRNFIDPSIAVAALSLSPEYLKKDLNTLGFLFESLCMRDLKIYSSQLGGTISYYNDRYGLEADCVLHLDDGRYALIEFKLGEHYIDEGAKHLLKIEKLINNYNLNAKIKLRKPDLKIIITASEFGYQRPDGILVIPIGCLKD